MSRSRLLARSFACVLAVGLAVVACPTRAHALTYTIQNQEPYCYGYGNGVTACLNNFAAATEVWEPFTMVYNSGASAAAGYTWTLADGMNCYTFPNANYVNKNDWYGIGINSITVIIPSGSVMSVSSPRVCMSGYQSTVGGTNVATINQTVCKPSNFDVWVSQAGSSNWIKLTADSSGFYQVPIDVYRIAFLYHFGNVGFPGGTNRLFLPSPFMVVDTDNDHDVLMNYLSEIDHRAGIIAERQLLTNQVLVTIDGHIQDVLNEIRQSGGSDIAAVVQNQTDALTDTSTAESDVGSPVSGMVDTVQNNLGGINDAISIGGDFLSGWQPTEGRGFHFPGITLNVAGTTFEVPSGDIDIWEVYPEFETVTRSAVTFFFFCVWLSGVISWYRSIFDPNYQVVEVEKSPDDIRI